MIRVRRTIEELTPDHLLPQVRAVLNWPQEKRIRAIRTDGYIPHEQAESIHMFMEDLLSGPKNIRPLGLLIVGPSGSGKTTIVREFMRRHPDSSQVDVEIKPVLYVETPPTAGESRLLGAILRHLGYTADWDRGNCDLKLKRVFNALRACRVELIILDEIHNMFIKGTKRPWESLSVIKALSNQLSLPVVLVGINSARNLISQDPQLASRLQTIELAPCKDGTEYRDFLYALESTLPLSRPSRLYSKEKATIILELSQFICRGPTSTAGILGNVTRIVKEAAIRALKDRTEMITVEHLRKASETIR
jgi:GTPase SAR1 family protein